MVAPVAEELKPAYLLTGSDRPKIERALRRLRRRVGDDALEILSATEASGEDAVAACNALGLFGDGSRLVLVDDAEKWRAPDAKVVAAYLADPAPATVLALVATGAVSDDGIIDPRDTRTVLGLCLSVVRNRAVEGAAGYGVFRL